MQNLIHAWDHIWNDLNNKTFANPKTEYVNLNDDGQPTNLVSERWCESEKSLSLITRFDFIKLCESLGLFSVQMSASIQNGSSISCHDWTKPTVDKTNRLAVLHAHQHVARVVGNSNLIVPELGNDALVVLAAIGNRLGTLNPKTQNFYLALPGDDYLLDPKP